jgi:hypothetical protein
VCLSDIRLLFSIKACHSESLKTRAKGNILFPQCHQKGDLSFTKILDETRR